MNIQEAMNTLQEAMKNDPDYAWGWLCNLAMSSQDENMPHSASNRAAARFMQNAFGVDMTKHKNFQDTQGRTDEVYEEVVGIADYLWTKYYKEKAPNWKPLDTTIAVLTQIDNMLAGID